MRNTIARQILEETPAETRQFVRRYGELVVRIHELLEQKGWSQKDLANRLGKSPSEISKWLSGDHNFTLRSLAKLEVELGEELIKIPKISKFQVNSRQVVHLEVTSRSNSASPGGNAGFTTWKPNRVTLLNNLSKTSVA